MWPRSLGQVATCSGGIHDYVANLGCPKGIAAPGVDIQAGLGEDSCGFAYLPPTVQSAGNSTGKLTPYTWVTRIDLTEREPDEVNVLGNLINARHRAVPDPVRLDDHDPFDLPAGLCTTSQAKAYCAAPYEAFKAMRTPEDHGFNAALNELAVVFGHFVPEFINARRRRGARLRLRWRTDRWSSRARSFAGHHHLGTVWGMAEPYKHSRDREPEIIKDDAEPEAGPTWRAEDLPAILDGTYVPMVPDLLQREDGMCLLYRGLVHSFHGEVRGGQVNVHAVRVGSDLAQRRTIAVRGLRIRCEHSGRSTIAHGMHGGADWSRNALRPTGQAGLG